MRSHEAGKTAFVLSSWQGDISETHVLEVDVFNILFYVAHVSEWSCSDRTLVWTVNFHLTHVKINSLPPSHGRSALFLSRASLLATRLNSVGKLPLSTVSYHPPIPQWRHSYRPPALTASRYMHIILIRQVSKDTSRLGRTPLMIGHQNGF